MEKKKISLHFAEAKNAAKGFLDKSKDIAVRAMDQNDDGKLDIADVAALADSVGGIVKRGAYAVKDGAEESRRQIERKSLQPIFSEDLDTTDFFISKLIRITDRDRKHAESDVCQGSIGYLSDKGGLRVVNIFKDSLELCVILELTVVFDLLCLLDRVGINLDNADSVVYHPGGNTEPVMPRRFQSHDDLMLSILRS